MVTKVKKAPFTLWGLQALRKEMCENGGVSAEQAAAMEKPDLVKALMELSATPAVDTKVDTAVDTKVDTAEPTSDRAPDGSGEVVVEEEAIEVVDEGVFEGEGAEELVEISDDDDDDDGTEYIELEGDLEESDGEEYADLAEKIMETSNDCESPPEPVKVGEAKLDELLTKAGLMDDVVSKMTVGDKKTYLAATTETRNQMKGDIEMSQTKTKTAAKAAKTPAKAAKTPAKAAKTPAKTTAKKGLSINDKLKKKDLWRPGTQFISNQRKEDLLAADTTRKQNIIFKEIAAKAEDIKLKQSKVAKANMKKAAAKK